MHLEAVWQVPLSSHLTAQLAHKHSLPHEVRRFKLTTYSKPSRMASVFRTGPFRILPRPMHVKSGRDSWRPFGCARRRLKEKRDLPTFLRPPKLNETAPHPLNGRLSLALYRRNLFTPILYGNSRVIIRLNTTYGLSTPIITSSKCFLRILLTQAVCRHIIGVASE